MALRRYVLNWCHIVNRKSTNYGKKSQIHKVVVKKWNKEKKFSALLVLEIKLRRMLLFE